MVTELVLWDAVTTYLRKLEGQCRSILGRSLPVDANPIRLPSWMGDRDGNPNVNPRGRGRWYFISARVKLGCNCST